MTLLLFERTFGRRFISLLDFYSFYLRMKTTEGNGVRRFIYVGIKLSLLLVVNVSSNRRQDNVVGYFVTLVEYELLSAYFVYSLVIPSLGN